VDLCKIENGCRSEAGKPSVM
uniref:Uncharacterized protein n=1 Tax=Amphimedon queenslandica TaxID=400682 RepID=A0A1X7TQ16_AMPQE